MNYVPRNCWQGIGYDILYQAKSEQQPWRTRIGTKMVAHSH